MALSAQNWFLLGVLYQLKLHYYKMHKYAADTGLQFQLELRNVISQTGYEISLCFSIAALHDPAVALLKLLITV